MEGLDKDDLDIAPTDNEIGAWKYLDYVESDEDFNKYYYNAREIDAREYAMSILGFNID